MISLITEFIIIHLLLPEDITTVSDKTLNIYDFISYITIRLDAILEMCLLIIILS